MKSISLPFTFIVFISMLFAACNFSEDESKVQGTRTLQSSDGVDRTVLPIKEEIPTTVSELDARNAKAPARFELKAPSKAPNVLIVLIDDIGFGHSAAFGGPIRMPNLDKLAGTGLKYNRFHTTALCSPTRTALLTGYNHHSNNAGAIMEIATAFPGNTGIRPQTITPAAQVLRMNGYSTAAFGKYHETPPWEISESGPMDRWPTGSGFDKFYGFIGGETNQWHPLVYDGVTPIDVPDENPGYHFTVDMTDHAITWMSTQQALTPDKPFYMYFATGATHAPHHAPREYADRYKGQFSMGWDKLREQTLERQKTLGVVPSNTVIAPKPPDIKDWDRLSTDEKRLFERQMEVFAGFAEHTDHEIGRLIDAIEQLGELDNTLIFYIVGDNGASAEGGMIGMYNESTYFNGVPETLEMQMKKIDVLGSDETYSHFAAGWAVAGNTPFTWTKQVASNFGGTRNGMVVHWPNGIKAKNEVRSQFHHVIDIAPTIYECTGIPAPKMVNGIEQRPIEGISMKYSFDNASAAGARTSQYFEIAGNRGIYSEGWFAGTVHKAPWEAKPRKGLAEDEWELYKVDEDFSMSKNLAPSNSAKLDELKKLFLADGEKYYVLPIDDRTIERFDARTAGRPDLMGDRKKLVLYPGMTRIMENAFINTKNISYKITAEIELGTNSNGVVVCQGGDFGGWTLYVKDNKPIFGYNWLGLESYSIPTPKKLSPGKHTVVYEFNYAGGGGGKGGKGVITIDGVKAGEGDIKNTHAGVFGLDEPADVGTDSNTPVVTAYKGNPGFTGKIKTVTIELL